MNKPIRYEIYVEGSFYCSFSTFNRSEHMINKLEKEGWNVKLIAIYKTIIGECGVEL